MTFLWPEMLWLALLLPFLTLFYVLALGRRRRNALRYSSLGLVRQAVAGRNWRRHLPPAMLLAALVALVIAGARPAAVLTLPTQQRTVMLAMDVSGSMSAADVAPDRITASQVAAKKFALELPPGVRIGVVAYGGTANLVQAPTLNREDVVAAIDRFQLQRGTAIGSGIVIALATLFPGAGIEIAQISGPPGSRTQRPVPLGQADPPEFKPMAPGSYGSASIVLLTDGQNTVGPDPMDAAQMAASRGVKIFTVGFGTRDGTTIGFEGWSMRVRLDEDTMKKVANLTLGEYFYAGSGTDLKNVYEALQSRLVFERKQTEITVLFAYLAGVLMLIATGLSMWWFGKVA